MSKQAYWLSRISRCATSIAWRSVRSPAATSASSARARPRRACAAYATDAVGQPVSAVREELVDGHGVQEAAHEVSCAVRVDRPRPAQIDPDVREVLRDRDEL